MADTTIGGRVMVWGDEPPRAQFPVRCLEDELLPAAAPLPPTAPPSEEGRQRAAAIAERRGIGSGATLCTSCRTYAAVEGTARCHRPICSPAGKVKVAPRARPCRGCTRHRALDDGFCGGGPCRAMAARIERLEAEGPAPRVTGKRAQR
jgi:hypothetical protein